MAATAPEYYGRSSYALHFRVRNIHQVLDVRRTTAHEAGHDNAAFFFFQLNIHTTPGIRTRPQRRPLYIMESSAVANEAASETT